MIGVQIQQTRYKVTREDLNEIVPVTTFYERLITLFNSLKYETRYRKMTTFYERLGSYFPTRKLVYDF